MAKQARAVRTREALILSAAESIDAHGLIATSLAEVRARVGISVGGMHFHFPNKHALARAVEAEAGRRLHAITGAVPGEGASPLDSVVTASYRLFTELDHDPVLRAGFALGRDKAWQSQDGVLNQWYAWLKETFTHAHLLGTLTLTAAEDAVTVVTATTIGLEALGQSDPEWSPAHRLAHLWRFLQPAAPPDAAAAPCR